MCIVVIDYKNYHVVLMVFKCCYFSFRALFELSRFFVFFWFFKTLYELFLIHDPDTQHKIKQINMHNKQRCVLVTHFHIPLFWLSLVELPLLLFFWSNLSLLCNV